MPSKALSKKIDGAGVCPELKFGLYTIQRRGKVYSFPFVSPSDELALQTVISASHDEPSLQGAKLYRIADFFITDGVIRAFRVPKLIGVKNGR